jgi:hypothetical protein
MAKSKDEVQAFAPPPPTQGGSGTRPAPVREEAAAPPKRRFEVYLKDVPGGPMVFEAEHADAAYAAYRKHHGILGSDHQPTVKELPPAEPVGDVEA